MGLAFIFNPTLGGRWTGRDENDEKKTQYSQGSHSRWHWVSASKGQCRVPIVCGGVAISVQSGSLIVRVQDEQWAASLGSRPASAAAVFGGTAAGLHNGTLSACQPRVPPRCPKRLNPAFRLCFSLSLETTQLYPSSMT